MRRNKGFTLISKACEGFTLIELLVVIAVLGVLMAGVVVAINPAKRIKQANDAKIKNDVGQLATALQAYYTVNQIYPASLALLAPGDLKQVPAGPGGTCAAYAYSATPTPCVIGGACEARVSCILQDPLVAANNVWCWRSATGQATATTAALCVP